MDEIKHFVCEFDILLILVGAKKIINFSLWVRRSNLFMVFSHASLSNGASEVKNAPNLNA